MLRALPLRAFAAARAATRPALATRAPSSPRFCAPCRAYGSSGSEVEADASTPSRVYAGFTVYCSKSAMQATLIRPRFLQSTNGEGDAYLALDREGVVLLEFAHAGSGEGGSRAYNWVEKENFALSVRELGEILDLEYGEEADWLHRPAQGDKQKSLRLSPLRGPGQKGFMFQLSVQAIQNGQAGQVYNKFNVPVERGNWRVIKEVARFAIPRLMGFDKMVEVPFVGREWEPSMMGEGGGYGQSMSAGVAGGGPGPGAGVGIGAMRGAGQAGSPKPQGARPPLPFQYRDVSPNDSIN